MSPTVAVRVGVLAAAIVAVLALAALAASTARAASLAVVPASPSPGKVLHAHGGGFRPHARGVLDLGSARVKAFRVDRRGRFALRSTVPARVRTGRRRLVVRAAGRRVSVRVRVRRTPGARASLSASSGSTRLLLTPWRARSGARRTLSGRGWPVGRRVRVRWRGRTLARPRVDRRGRFSARVSAAGARGHHRLHVRGHARRLSVPLSIRAASSSPGTPDPSPPPGPTPPPPPPPPPPVSPSDPVIGAAGDIACGPADPVTATRCHHAATSDLLLGSGLSAVLPLGDLQYPHGELADFRAAYAPTWGRLDAIAHPVVGNHEYDLGDAGGYFDYFGARAGDRDKGYYHVTIGGWHLYALNSNCAQVSCAAGSAQETWLRAALAEHRGLCQIAYWHAPLFNTGRAGRTTAMAPIWRDLQAAAVEVVLAGHDHHYERFAPQDATGTADPRGPRQFVVGTGGASHAPLPTTAPSATSEVRNYDTFGVLTLALHPASYDWRFVPEPGGTFTDAGSGPCR